MMNYLFLEWLCLKQHIQFSLRHKRYLIIAITQYLYFFKSPKHSFHLRLTYCTLQLIDDIIDGDRKFPYEIDQYIQKLITGKIEQLPPHDLRYLYQATLAKIKNDFDAKTEAEEKFIRLIQTMLFDYNRVSKKIILNQAELKSQHYKTFSDSLDIVLMALGSNLRTQAVPSILEIFAWCSTVRDLEEDIQKGLINIPSNIFFNIKNFYSLKSKEIINHPSLVSYLNQWTAEIENLYPTAYAEYELIKDQKGSSIIKIFLDSMKKYLKHG